MKTRSEAVELALAWKGTPYATGACVCQGGCDCATFVKGYLLAIGAATEIPLFTYAQDWFCHTEEERYFNELSKYATCTWQGRCVGTPPVQPGDIAIFRCNLRTGPTPRYSHGCIVTRWPRALHTFDKTGVMESRPALHPLTAGAEMAIFNPFLGPTAFAVGGIVEPKTVLVGETVSDFTIPKATAQRLEKMLR